jgi:signal transduction histidine kinase
MRRPSFGTALAAWTLALVVGSVGAVAVATHVQATRHAREEAARRAERSLARAAERLALGGELVSLHGDPGVEVTRRPRAEVDAAFGDPRVELWRAAIADPDAGVRSRTFADGLGAVAVVALPDGGLLEARLRGEAIDTPFGRYAGRAAAVTGVVAVVAVLASLALARRVAAPVGLLSAAARRLGGGDLDTPLPAVEGGELGTLAATLERMRERLFESTRENERRRAELEAVLASVSEGVYAVDRDRRVRYLSPRAAELLGVAVERAVGVFCGDLLRPLAVDGERPCETACPILQARFRGPVRATERLEAPDGERRVVLSSSPPAGGLQVQILREETAVEAARRARDAVVADLAHELKTPLAAQRASLELLAERIADADPDAARLAAGIENGVLRLERLIENLLESVRIESGELGIRRQAVELDEVVEEAIGTTAPLAAQRGQRIEVDLPYPLPALAGDPPRLVQVLVNLLANASKFAPVGSAICVGGEVDAGAVRLWVEDEGPGFDPAELERRAARFRRGAGGGEPREPGSGLGLWIARSIVERHGGALRVERRAGRTRVGLELPATESAP